MEHLRQFFSNDWAVNYHDLSQVVSLMAPCIMSGNLQGAEDLLKQKTLQAQAVAAPNMASTWELDDLNLPVNSIAVIQLSGMIFCWETDWLISKVKQAESNPQICGIVLVIDGPGGHATRIDVAARVIREATKPVATVVVGDMCSAHYWIGTSADRVFATSPLCTVGSVGVMGEYMVLKGYFKQLGIDVHTIYADTSDLKNEEIRALEDKGDESLIKRRFEKIHKVFCEDVAANLGIAYDPELEIFRGRVFTCDEAVAAGYIDEIGTIEDAVLWVMAQATSRQAAELYK